jgi:hypothetical protein
LNTVEVNRGDVNIYEEHYNFYAASVIKTPKVGKKDVVVFFNKMQANKVKDLNL